MEEMFSTVECFLKQLYNQFHQNIHIVQCNEYIEYIMQLNLNFNNKLFFHVNYQTCLIVNIFLLFSHSKLTFFFCVLSALC